MTFKELPMIIMGGSALIGGILTLFLPETLGSLMLESITEIEQLKTNTNPFFSWWSTKTLKAHLDEMTTRKSRNP